MKKTFSTQCIEHKANIYKILSVLFKQPEEDFQFYLSHLKISLKKVYPELWLLAEKLEEDFNEHKNELTHLRVEHAKLFVGPFDVFAPPYSSIYLQQGRTVYGESTLQALTMYNEAGIEMSKEFKDLPDHISVELEFIYFLYFTCRENGKNISYLKNIEAFLNTHLIQWVSPFIKKIEERSTLNFYKIVGTILVEFIYRDAVELKKVVNS